MNDSDRDKGIYIISGISRYDSMYSMTPGICQPSDIVPYNGSGNLCGYQSALHLRAMEECENIERV